MTGNGPVAGGAMRRQGVGARIAGVLAALCMALAPGSPPHAHAAPAVAPVRAASEHAGSEHAAGGNVHLARSVGSPVAQPSHMRWLVVASRPSPAEAIAYAREFSLLVAPALVVSSSTGWYAVLAGELDMPKGEVNLANLRDVRLIPGDSYLSTGERFGPVLWSGYAPGADHDVMDQFAVQLTVRRIQGALAALGLYEDAVDGLLGRGTVAAWRRYERRTWPGRSWGEDRLREDDIGRLEHFPIT